MEEEKAPRVWAGGVQGEQSVVGGTPPLVDAFSAQAVGFLTQISKVRGDLTHLAPPPWVRRDRLRIS